jgi:hypothetical protein
MKTFNHVYRIRSDLPFLKNENISITIDFDW